ncbi:hypothetical protein B5V02_24135 [Mesorhizobium kowhaii]|uniref:Uncharacterized protein n=1 Tax=Mesorhizobium kowhaii TaxID=1300272 RepID=A0A2W7C1V8_9HYPH|nr:hypothetical protein B5V02_24135 [Mesorhizobium kowhaii]
MLITSLRMTASREAKLKTPIGRWKPNSVPTKPHQTPALLSPHPATAAEDGALDRAFGDAARQNVRWTDSVISAA